MEKTRSRYSTRHRTSHQTLALYQALNKSPQQKRQNMLQKAFTLNLNNYCRTVNGKQVNNKNGEEVS